MPELPEVEALARFLDERARGLEVARVDVASVAVLKTFDPPVDALGGLTLQSCGRRGKYLMLKFGRGEMGRPPSGAGFPEPLWLILHLARGGWVRWVDALRPGPARRGKSPLALRVAFVDGSGFDVTEAGTEKRVAAWLVRDPNQVEQVATLGIDPLAPGFDTACLAQLLKGLKGQLKSALTDQRLLAGVGNAYSDEALHVARLSPFKPAANLSAEEVERLHTALVTVLTDAVERSAGLPASGLKKEKKEGLRVHGRTGEPCPICGDTVREVAFADKSLQYCPTCQTGGKPLADRRFSKFLK